MAKRHAKLNAKKLVDTNLLGPCAMNCSYCLAYKKGACLGCRYQADKRAADGVLDWCPLLNCADRRGVRICSECKDYPCEKEYNPKNSMFSSSYMKYIREKIKPL